MKPIQAPILDQLRQDSLASHEVFTTKYVEYCFNKVIFPEPEFIWSSQQPPCGNNPNDARSDYRRIDLSCDHYSPGRNWSLSRRIIYEGKRGDCTVEELSICEQQAMSGCTAYCGNTGKRSLWAITGFTSYADKSQYVDLPSIPTGSWGTLKSNHEVPRGVFTQNLPSNDDSTLQTEAGTSNSAPTWNYDTPGPSGTSSTPMSPLKRPQTWIWTTREHQTRIPQMHLPSKPPGAASKGKGRRKPEIPVVVREEKHMTTSDLWCFTDVKGKPRRTERGLWKEKYIDGHKRWTYEGGRTVYYKFELKGKGKDNAKAEIKFLCSPTMFVINTFISLWGPIYCLPDSLATPVTAPPGAGTPILRDCSCGIGFGLAPNGAPVTRPSNTRRYEQTVSTRYCDFLLDGLEQPYLSADPPLMLVPSPMTDIGDRHSSGCSSPRKTPSEVLATSGDGPMCPYG
ncbi:hypothetical protein PG988_006582 [Apiospora saccharicola]